VGLSSNVLGFIKEDAQGPGGVTGRQVNETMRKVISAGMLKTLSSD
jgi:hypothetical protein